MKQVIFVLGAAAICSLQGTPSYAQRVPDYFVPNRVLVHFREEATPVAKYLFRASAGATDLGEIHGTGIRVMHIPRGFSEAAMMAAMARQPEVESVELDEIYPPSDLIPNDTLFSNQWALGKIAGPTAWSTSTGSNTITIAILDSGVDSTHPDLANKIVPGWNFYDNNSNTSDVFGHGTAVAGTATAASNNSTGVASVAWQCRLMPIRISDTSGNASTTTIASGLTWAADHGARVANISYACSSSSTVATAAKYFQDKGGVVVVSAGNSGTTSVALDNPYVLNVSATDANDALYSWSNRGTDVDLAAPGVVYTTNRGGGYGGWQGTSFSSPLVAGVAALVLSVRPALSGADVQNILCQSADDKGLIGKDTSYGWGRVNAARAVAMALSSAADTTPPVVGIASPTTGAIVSGTTSVSVNATDNRGVRSVDFYIDGSLQTSTTITPYAYSWNTKNWPNGIHTVGVVATDTSGNTASAQVIVTVNNIVDIIAPTVAITSPAYGSKVGKSFTVTANASDNIGVVRVELWIDGTLDSTDTSAPYSFSVNTNARKWAANTSHALICRAYDAKGNVGVSTTISVKN
ncbi:MAG: S8 family serine peptidase [Armatimonas sp.]